MAFAAARRSSADRGLRALGALVPEDPVIRALRGRRSPWLPHSARMRASQAADECKGLPICIPVTGPWVAIPPRTAASRRRDLASSTCPQGRRRRRRRAGERARGRGRVPGAARQPRQPGHHDRGLARLPRHLRRTRAPGHELPAVHRLHPGRRRGTRARPSRSRRPRRAPSSRASRSRSRVTTLRWPGHARSRHARCQAERAPAAAARIASGSTPHGVPTKAQLAAVHVVRVRSGSQILVSATRRGLPAGIRAEVQVQAVCAR